MSEVDIFNFVFLLELSNVVSKALFFVNRKERGEPERVLERDETNAPAHDKWPPKCILNVEGLILISDFLIECALVLREKCFIDAK